jgi:5-methylcytosine-specific restriction endonuclease McrA
VSSRARYDAERGNERERGYTARWTDASAKFRIANPLCHGCKALGIVEPSRVTDHVLPHKGNMIVFWDTSKWQPACYWHHDAVKKMQEVSFASGTINEAELWLDSDIARQLTLRLRPVG